MRNQEFGYEKTETKKRQNHKYQYKQRDRARQHTRCIHKLDAKTSIHILQTRCILKLDAIYRVCVHRRGMDEPVFACPCTRYCTSIFIYTWITIYTGRWHCTICMQVRWLRQTTTCEVEHTPIPSDQIWRSRKCEIPMSMFPLPHVTLIFCQSSRTSYKERCPTTV